MAPGAAAANHRRTSQGLVAPGIRFAKWILFMMAGSIKNHATAAGDEASCEVGESWGQKLSRSMGQTAKYKDFKLQT